MQMIRAQQNGKALHSFKDNSILGSYFRKRLGLKSGALIILEHLIKYGRMDISMEKIDYGRYNLDFSIR